MADKKLYFAYASCLLRERLQNSIPNPIFKTIAKLLNYELGFGVYSPKWHGNMAIGVPKEGSELWGTVWEVSSKDMAVLYSQEGVDKGKFRAEPVKVTTPEGSQLEVIVILPNHPPQKGALPSPQYKKVIVDGAVACGMPSDYIDKLKKIQTNNYSDDIGLSGENF